MMGCVSYRPSALRRLQPAMPAAPVNRATHTPIPSIMLPCKRTMTMRKKQPYARAHAQEQTAACAHAPRARRGHLVSFSRCRHAPPRAAATTVQWLTARPSTPWAPPSRTFLSAPREARLQSTRAHCLNGVAIVLRRCAQQHSCQGGPWLSKGGPWLSKRPPFLGPRPCPRRQAVGKAASLRPGRAWLGQAGLGWAR